MLDFYLGLGISGTIITFCAYNIWKTLRTNFDQMNSISVREKQWQIFVLLLFQAIWFFFLTLT